MSLVAISYDRVEDLAEFAVAHGITYPLLADVGSEVIIALGLLNEHVFEQHLAYGIEPKEHHRGVPYPGVFLLDEDGVVAEKRFFESYRERETGAGLLERALGIASGVHGPAATGEVGPVRVSVRFDADDYKPWQRLWMYIDVDIAPGWHVFANGSPSEFASLDVAIEEMDGMFVGEADWPEPRLYAVAGLPGEFPVHEGTVSGRVPVSFRIPPGAGSMTVKGEVQIQACSEVECLMPGAIPFALSLAEGCFLRPGR